MATRKFGKIIKIWKYVPHGGGTVVEVPLRFHEWVEYGTEKSEFRVEITEPCPITASGKDADVLKKEVWAKLGEYFKVKWNPFFEVTVSFVAAADSHGSGAIGRRIHFEYRAVDLGSRDNGDKVHRYETKTYLNKDWPSTGQHMTGSFNGEPVTEMVSLVPATAENEQRLDSIIKAIELLAARMQDFLSPNKILTTLANTGLLLPEPKKGKKNEER
jgi:hypothetical protein